MRPQEITAAVSQQPAQDVGVQDVLSASVFFFIFIIIIFEL